MFSKSPSNTIQELINNRYDVSEFPIFHDEIERKLIHYYCIYSNLNGLLEFLQLFGNKDINLADKYGLTCAHFAARNGNLEILEILAKNKFDKWNAKEKRYYLTPLAIAISMRHSRCIEFLINYANQEVLNQALILTAQEDEIEYLKLVISKKANVHLSDENNLTALYYACLNGNIEMTQYLLAKV